MLLLDQARLCLALVETGLFLETGSGGILFLAVLFLVSLSVKVVGYLMSAGCQLDRKNAILGVKSYDISRPLFVVKLYRYVKFPVPKKAGFSWR